MQSDLYTRSMRHIWHPGSQMKDYETFKPLEVIAASGPYITLKDGRKIIDAISSWWCKSLGHNHPRVMRAVRAQMEQFEHVILANTTNERIVALTERLAKLTNLPKVFYACDGSSAVEIALKMSLHARQIQGDGQRTRFIALENAYHGETIGALSVSDLGLYNAPYKSLFTPAFFIRNVPYVSGTEDPLWEDCAMYWEKIQEQLQTVAETATAVIVEPILQGAAGMKIYSKDFLRRLRQWTKAHDIHLIADEIASGMGRTGKMFAVEHAEVVPDFMCISKGLTSGALPLSATLTTDAIYTLFYDDYAKGKSFLHSHTQSGNALAVAAAVEVLTIYREESICAKAQSMASLMRAHMQDIADSTKTIKNLRGIGGIVAADLVDQAPRAGYKVYQKAVAEGLLLRCIGNVVYWLPPLNSAVDLLAELHKLTKIVLERDA